MKATLTGKLLAGLLLAAAAIASPAQTITSLDDPNAGTGSGQGTSAVAINTAGIIARIYTDAGGLVHGFMRSATGTITSYDAPGSMGALVLGDFEMGINTAGEIAGCYLDSGSVFHGYLRTP
jgi:hypothetical protein